MTAATVITILVRRADLLASGLTIVAHMVKVRVTRRARPPQVAIRCPV
jgi:hypothetical protein